MQSQPIDIHDTADARLRRDGQRYTANRRVLIDALRAADRPVTVLELIDALEALDDVKAVHGNKEIDEKLMS